MPNVPSSKLQAPTCASAGTGANGNGSRTEERQRVDDIGTKTATNFSQPRAQPLLSSWKCWLKCSSQANACPNVRSIGRSVTLKGQGVLMQGRVICNPRKLRSVHPMPRRVRTVGKSVGNTTRSRKFHPGPRHALTVGRSFGCKLKRSR